MNKLRHYSFLFICAFPALVAVSGSIVYFVYGLNFTGALISGAVSLLGFLYILKLDQGPEDTETSRLEKINRQQLLLFGLFSLTWLISLYLLYKGRSDRPIITPWQVVSSWYFISYAIGAALLFFLARSSSRLTLPALIMQSLLLFGVAAVVYRIGYGFDPFIHEAAVRAIEELGQIIPLTPYYLGQYSLVTVAHAWAGINPALFAKLLVPFFSALLLPVLIFRWLIRHHGTERNWALSAVVLLILPASLFIITTPQNLAYLFLLIVLFLPSPEPSRSEKIIVWLAALAAFFCQPIAGIPALCIAAVDSLTKAAVKKRLLPLVFAGLVFAVPLALFIFSKIGNAASVSLSWPNLSFLSSLLPENPQHEDWWINFTYLYHGLWGIILLGLGIFGAYVSFKTKRTELIERSAWPSLALVASSLVTSCISFHFLIEYERSDYAERLAITALLVALPLTISALDQWALRLEKTNRYNLALWLLIFCSAATATLYLSYPRFDDHVNSHGYATSKADIEAVRWIENDAKGKAYAVLSNQQVSAAALREYGFKHYYKNNIFYYPIPTGGELYQQYLAMVEKPDRAAIAKAMELTGTDRIYFVLNSYWWEYKKLAGEAAFIANKSADIGSGQISIFVFSRN